jgi:hypothetical protein
MHAGFLQQATEVIDRLAANVEVAFQHGSGRAFSLAERVSVEWS